MLKKLLKYDRDEFFNYDLALADIPLAKYVINLPYFKKIIGTEFYTVTGNKGEAVDSNTVRNTNYMMGEYNGAEYFYPYSLGG